MGLIANSFSSALRALRAALHILVLASLTASPAIANNIGEDGAWSFQSGAERSARSTTADMIQRERGGYYQSFRTTINNNTYIGRQVNCTLAATTTGNSGSSSMSAYTSSPVVSNANSNGASTSANGNSTQPGGAGSGLSNSQSNTGSLNSGVYGSSTGSSTGPISAGGGHSSQVLNNTQSNTGLLTASVSGSTACAGLNY